MRHFNAGRRGAEAALTYSGWATPSSTATPYVQLRHLNENSSTQQFQCYISFHIQPG
jgi:hypothetical protein